MNTTLEDKLFAEFKSHGAAALCLDYVMTVILQEDNGLFAKSRSWKDYYDSIPAKVTERTKDFDNAAWPINIKDEYRIAQEISDNLDELVADKRERYIIQILEVFEDWAKAFTPCAQIQTMEQAIQRHSAYDFHSESDYIKAIEQIRGLHDRLLEVMDNKKYGEIANHFEHWYRAYYFFCDMLAAELAKHNINILEIQNKRGIWLVEKLDVFRVQSYFGYDGNYNYANSLLNSLPTTDSTRHLITVEDNGTIRNRASDITPTLIDTTVENAVEPPIKTPSKRGRRNLNFSDFLIGDEVLKSETLKILHKLIDGHKGKDVAFAIRACMSIGLLRHPTFKAVESEFGDIGNRSGFNKYLNNERAFTSESLANIAKNFTVL